MQRYPVQIRMVHFPLHPETPMEGLSLVDLFRGRDMSAARQRLQSAMTAASLPYGERTMTYNSRLAQELGKWADTQPGGEALHGLIYRAYFVANQNIADKRILVQLAADAGLDPQTAQAVLDQRSYADPVDRDWDYSRSCGVDSVPSLLGHKRLLVGYQPLEVLEQFVKGQ